MSYTKEEIEAAIAATGGYTSVAPVVTSDGSPTSEAVSAAVQATEEQLAVMDFNKPLEKEDIYHIIDVLSEELFHRIKEVGYNVELTKGAKDFITDKGFDPKYGARPLKRAIQRHIEDPLAEALLENKKPEGSTIKIKLNKSRDDLSFSWSISKSKSVKTSNENNPQIENPKQNSNQDGSLDNIATEEKDTSNSSQEQARKV